MGQDPAGNGVDGGEPCGDPQRLGDLARVADAMREACIQTLLTAYEDARIRGLCDEGALEYAVAAVRRLDGAVVAREAGYGRADPGMGPIT